VNKFVVNIVGVAALGDPKNIYANLNCGSPRAATPTAFAIESSIQITIHIKGEYK
jgi:hypothetical protein